MKQREGRESKREGGSVQGAAREARGAEPPAKVSTSRVILTFCDEHNRSEIDKPSY